MKTCALVLAPMLALGCGGSDAHNPPSACPRYQERVAEACQPVAVTDVVETPLRFERAGLVLEGTLTLPRTAGTYRAPGVVLVHGSGPNDRDETSRGELGAVWPEPIPVFEQLAHGLARAGAAVYRYDKRGCFVENSEGRCGQSIDDYPGNLAKVLFEDFILDARGALDALRARPEVDPDDLTVIGHSEGGYYVPIILQDEPGLVAGVQLAGPSEALDGVWVSQLRELADELEAMDADFYKTSIDAMREQADQCEKDFAALRAGTFRGTWYQGAPVAYWKNAFAITDKVRDTFVATTKPMLLLNGTNDRNVRPRHLKAFQDWAQQAEMANAQFQLLQDVRHAFVTLADDNSYFDPNFSPVALARIVEWHRALTK